MKHLDLFSGIGGFALATEMVWQDVEHLFVEYDPFCQALLTKHWPQSYIHGDIKTFTADTLNAGLERCEQNETARHARQRNRERSNQARNIDLLTGGFPCQPFSQAGLRKGTDDDRYLWPEMLRAIQLAKPTWVIAENVGGLVTWNDGMVLERVCIDLESESYEVQSFIIPACAVNAPHRRDRIWIVGHAKHDGLDGAENGESDTSRSDSNQKRQNKLRKSKGANSVRESIADWDRNWTEVATALCRVDDGIPRRLDRTPRLKALGNAIVPQVAAEIMSAIITL